MKDNLFELLLKLFEQSLSQLQKSNQSIDPDTLELNGEEASDLENQSLYIRTAQLNSTRVFTYDEQMKLTKASYQFLMKMKLLGIIDNDGLELIMNQLQFSESRIVILQETKWAIRNVLSSNLNEEQLAFLDLVLYQSEDELTLH